MLLSILTALLALGLGLYLTPMTMKAACELGIMSKPDGELRTHQEPVPYLGGVAIYLSLLIALAVAVSFSAGMLALLLGISIMLIVGLIDDFGAMTPRVKLFGQIVAAAALIKGGVVIELDLIENVLWPDEIPLLAWFLSALWLIGITNALNFLDIEDGMAGGVAASCCPALFVVALRNGRMDAAIFTAALFGATLAFLRYNAPLPRARIFLGDAGSLFLGLSLAALAMTGSYTGHNDLAAVCPLLILGVPCFELGVTVAARLRRGRPIWFGSPDHVAKRLHKLGLSKRTTLVLHCVASLALGALALFVMNTDIKKAVITVSIVAPVALVAAFSLLSIEIEWPARQGSRPEQGREEGESE